LVQYGISELATEERVGVPMLRMINLQSDTWDLSDLKYIAMSEKERNPYLLRPGDILFNRTNSKELVGKCAVFTLSDEYVFASYLIRVRLKKDSLLPDYVVAYLASPLGRRQIDAVSRQIAGMTNINAEEIRELLIPVPNRTMQEKVAAAWRDAIRRRDQTLESARTVLASTNEVFFRELSVRKTASPTNTLQNRIFRRAYSEVTGTRLDPFFHEPHFVFLEKELRADKRYIPIRSLGYLVRGVIYSSEDERPEGVTVIRANNIDLDTGELDLGDLVRVRPDIGFGEDQRIEKNDILICAASGSKQHAGKVCFIADPIDAYFGGFMMVLRCTTDSLLSEYLAYYMQSELFRQSIFRHLGGTNINNLSVSMVSNLGVLVPEMVEQKRICTAVRNLRTKARGLREQAKSRFTDDTNEIEALILGRRISK
jgi:type I restriction enzyme, S subunit